MSMILPLMEENPNRHEDPFFYEIRWPIDSGANVVDVGGGPGFGQHAGVSCHR